VQHVVDYKQPVMRLQEMRKQQKRQETQLLALKEVLEELKQRQQRSRQEVREKEEQRQKKRNLEQRDEELERLREEESKVKKCVEAEMNVVQCDVQIISDTTYSIRVLRKRQAVARVEVSFALPHVLLRVSLHPSVLKTERKRLETCLPITKEWMVKVVDLKESICRCLWIIVHSL
jgi:hypothetical protein